MASPATRSIGRLAPAAGALALFVGAMWVANQGGFIPDSGEAAEKFFGTIYQGARSLPILLPLWIGALGIGLPLRNWLAPRAQHRMITQLSLGLGAMLMLDWLLAACGWLNPWTAWAVCGLGTAVITYHFADPATRERWHPDHWPSPPWTVLLALPAFGLLVVACTMPPGTMWAVEAFGYDVTSYHLEVPREWIESGQMRSLQHNVYSHLPMLVEAGYMKIGVMHGSMFDAVYTIQFFHASTAVLAAAAVARLVMGFAGGLIGASAGAVMLASPWTIITGSLAYNEMFVQVFAAAALVALFDPQSATPRGAVLIGIFVGLAAMAKLTAAGFVALPIAAGFVVWRCMRGDARAKPASGVGSQSFTDASGSERTPLPLREGLGEGKAPNEGTHNRSMNESGRNKASNGNQSYSRGSSVSVSPTLPQPLPEREGRRTLLLLASLTLAAAVVVAPFLIRNAIWTGNPAFPFATGVFGSAHWSQEQVDRWNKAHHTGGFFEGLKALPRQWLLSTGYGALGGQPPDQRAATDVARFETENGLPLLWIIAAISAVLLFRSPGHRPLAASLCALLAMQLLFWLVATHHQSRFLIPTLLPGCVLVGLGLGQIAELSRGKRDWLAPAVGGTLAGCLTLVSFGTFFSQTPRFTDDASREMVLTPPYLLVDSLVDPADVTANQPGKFAGAHPINLLPATSNVLLVGDANQVLYIHRTFRYSTAFDRGLLAELLDRHQGNAALVTLALTQLQVTHVWINFSELNRLRDSYGLDSSITPASIAALTKLWRPVKEIAGREVPGNVGLFALPAVRIRQPATGTSGFTTDHADDTDKKEPRRPEGK